MGRPHQAGKRGFASVLLRVWRLDYRRQEAAEARYKKKESDREYIRFVETMESKAHTPRSTLTFGDALDAYERRCEERTRNWVRAGMPSRRDLEWLAAGTLYVTKTYIASHIRPHVGHIRLSHLTTVDHLQPLINDLAARFSAAHERIAQIVRFTLEYIKEDLGWIARSPLEIKKLKIPPRRQPNTLIPTISRAASSGSAFKKGHPPSRSMRI